MRERAEVPEAAGAGPAARAGGEYKIRTGWPPQGAGARRAFWRAEGPGETDATARGGWTGI
jgi:hypothetical protein